MYKRLDDSLPESRKLGKIGDFAFRCWAVGLTKADWFGRLTAEPDKFILKCFPNRRTIADEEVALALDELANVGEGLVHLYIAEDGKRYMVFHHHEEHNPSGGWKTKPCKCPPPPRGLCRCLKYTQQESRKPVKGKEFRFQPTLFPTGQSGDEPDRNGKFGSPVSPLSTNDLAAATGQSEPTDHCSSPAPLLSSSSPPGEGCGERGAFDRIAVEFQSLTGRSAVPIGKNRAEVEAALAPLLERRGADACIRLIRDRVTEQVRRTGAPPGSLLYFVPVFQDDAAFANGGAAGWVPPEMREARR